MSRIPSRPALPLILLALSSYACSPQVDNNYSGEPLASIRGAVSSNAAPTAADVAVLWFSNQGGECTGPITSCSGGGGGDVEAIECAEACGPMPDVCDAASHEVYGACVQACGWSHSFQISWDLCVDGASGERVSVEGEFPAAFTLDLFQPPPDDALLADADGLRLAYGWFIVADPDVETITLSLYDDAPPQAIIGGSGTHVLIYAADPITADSNWGQYFGSALEVGYHVVEVVPGVSCDEPPVDPEPGYTCFATPNTYALSAEDLATEISVELAAFETIAWPSL